MNRLYTTLLALFIGILTLQAQQDVIIHVTDAVTSMDIENAEVYFDNMSQTTDASGFATFFAVLDGTYSYTVSKTCYDLETSELTVSGGLVNEEAALTPMSTNNVFFFIGDFDAQLDVYVELVGPDGYYNAFTTSEFFGGEMIADVPFGEYSYFLSKTCFAPISGSLTVDCNNGDGAAVFENMEAASTNSVFFFVGDPMAELGVYVELIGPDGYYNGFTTSDTFGGEMVADVPFGEYTYVLSKPCFATVSGSVTVDCNNGDGIGVFESMQQANNVFFFVGDPMAELGVYVELIGPDGYYNGFTTSDTFGGEMVADVPLGEYSYVLSKPCFTTVSGTVTVDCNNGDGIAVFEPMVPASSNTVFFFAGDPMAELGVLVELIGPDGYYSSFTTSDTFGGETIEDVPFGEYTYVLSKPCFATVSGTITVDCNNGDGIAVFEPMVPVNSNTVFFFAGDPMAELGVLVELIGPDGYYSSFTTSDTFGGETIEDVPFGAYSYVLSKPCFATVSGTVTVDCNNGDGIAVFEPMVPTTSNTVFFFVGDPMAELGVLVELIGPDGYYSSFTTSDTFGGETIEDVPFGTYDYYFSKPCFAPVSGTVTVDCNNGDGIAVFEPMEAGTSNTVFFFIGEVFAELDVTVEFTGPDGYSETFITSDTFGGETLEDVPYGEYTYVLSKPCFTTVTGTVSVNCNNGDGIAVFDQPEPLIIDDTVTQDQSVLTANESGATYQWLDCNDETPISGATSQSFTAEASGSYAVSITIDGCEVISECIEVIISGLNDIHAIEFNAYPNPVEDILTIALEDIQAEVEVQLYSMTGSLVMSQRYSMSSVIRLDMSAYTTGIYSLHILTDGARAVQSVHLR